MIIRLPKEQAIFLYQILESHDNLVNYSTQTTDSTLGYRDIAIYIPLGLEEEFANVLKSLSELDIKIIDLPQAEPPQTESPDKIKT